MAITELTDTTNTDGIGAAVGDLLGGLNADDAISDDLLDSELEAKKEAKEDTEVTDADLAGDVPEQETPEPKAEEEVAPAPLTYEVDRQSKSAEFVKVYTAKDGTVQGAVVEGKDIPALQQRLSKADYYEANFQGAVERAAAAKLNSYEFKDELGAQHKGAAAFEAAVTENAKLAAVARLFAETISTPEKLLALAYAVQEGDTKAFDAIRERAAFAADKAGFDAQKRLGARVTEQSSQASEQDQRAQITQTSIAQSVQHWGQQFPALTPDDLGKAVSYLSKLGSALVRSASPEEATALKVEPGTLIVDHPAVYEYLKERAELRSAAAANVKATQTAASENAKRLAAAARGKKGAPPRARVPAKPSDPSPEGETWAQQKERLQAGEFATVE